MFWRLITTPLSSEYPQCNSTKFTNLIHHRLSIQSIWVDQFAIVKSSNVHRNGYFLGG